MNDPAPGHRACHRGRNRGATLPGMTVVWRRFAHEHARRLLRRLAFGNRARARSSMCSRRNASCKKKSKSMLVRCEGALPAGRDGQGTSCSRFIGKIGTAGGTGCGHRVSAGSTIRFAQHGRAHDGLQTWRSRRARAPAWWPWTRRQWTICADVPMRPRARCSIERRPIGARSSSDPDAKIRQGRGARCDVR